MQTALRWPVFKIRHFNPSYKQVALFGAGLGFSVAALQILALKGTFCF